MLNTRAFELFAVLYFVIHIPITLLVDSQCGTCLDAADTNPHTIAAIERASHTVLGKYVEFPAFAQQMVAGFVRDFDDQLVCLYPIRAHPQDHVHALNTSPTRTHQPRWATRQSGFSRSSGSN